MAPFATANWGHSRGDFLKLKGVFSVSLVAAAVMATLSSCSTATSAPAAPVAVSAAKPIESTNSQSYIVEATSTDVAAQAVHAAGGQVVSRLGVIDAVE